jgi:hypothetical protein
MRQDSAPQLTAVVLVLLLMTVAICIGSFFFGVSCVTPVEGNSVSIIGVQRGCIYRAEGDNPWLVAGWHFSGIRENRFGMLLARPYIEGHDLIIPLWILAMIFASRPIKLFIGRRIAPDATLLPPSNASNVRESKWVWNSQTIGGIIVVLTLMLGFYFVRHGQKTIVQIDPKEKELASLRVGIAVIHTPDHVKAQVGGGSKSKYTWLFKTTVKSLRGPLTIQEFGAFVWFNGQWIFTTYTGKPFTRDDFASWYSCPNGTLEPSIEYTDPNNWTGGKVLQGSKSKWYYIATDQTGERFKGEAVTEELPELGS